MWDRIKDKFLAWLFAVCLLGLLSYGCGLWLVILFKVFNQYPMDVHYMCVVLAALWLAAELAWKWTMLVQRVVEVVRGR